MKLSLLGLIKIELIDLNKLKFIACIKISDKFGFIEQKNCEKSMTNALIRNLFIQINLNISFNLNIIKLKICLKLIQCF